MKLFRIVEITDNEGYRVGDVITFTLNDGEEVEAMAVKKEQDGMIFCLVDCLRKEYSMNPPSFNRGKYESCALRKKLNTKILDRFPAEIREKMIAFPNGDLLRLPTEREIFGENIYGVEEDDSVKQWKPMKKRKNRIAFQGKDTNALELYWLQNRCDDFADKFTFANSNGYTSYTDASNFNGVRPVFKI